MKKNLKRFLSSLLAGAMVLSSLAVPAMAADYVPMVEGDTVLNEWKFDFGSETDVAEGYTAVTADTNYVLNGSYGFIGIDGEGHKLGGRLDGFANQEGQTIELAAGGGTGLNDGIGSVGADDFGNAGDKYYPVRFALKVEDEQYFRIKATVTGLDQTKDANVTVYTERKHPIIKNTTVKAGETKTVEFSIRTTPIYYEKSDPKGTIADGMVNVCVLGENSALAALEIQQVETFPVMWVLGDSTVTDGNTTLPFFDLQNYTGVGTGLTMYLPRTMAMVNEGEGGLNAADNNHYNMVASRIKAGDYMYVEYGHNHKNDGTAGYLANLDKYYNKCHEVGAKLLIVSPIERINQWDSTNLVYTQSLNGFADTGEQYVKDKVADGATDIAYVDLNDYSINFYNKITADNNNDPVAIKYYFQTPKGGAVDQTHPNDAGAEHLAYEFMKAAQAVTDETQKAVLAGFLDDMTTETPKLVSADIIAGGYAGEAWPKYVVENLPELPVVIDDVALNEDGSIKQVDVTTRQATTVMEGYGIIVITVTAADGTEKGKIYAVDQVDNSTGYGPQTIKNFRGDVTIAEGDTYSAIVMKALDSGSGLVVDEEANLAYSATYKPTNIATYILTGEETDVETFEYYGATNLNDTSDWVYGGSSAATLTLGTDDDGVPYSTIASNGGGASWFLMRPLENLGDAGTGYTGKYLVSMDMIYNSGNSLTFAFAESTTPAKSPFVGNNLALFTVGSSGDISVNGTSAGAVSSLNWTNVQYILDMDLGTAEVSVGGGTPVVVDIPMYQTTGTPSIPTFKHFVLSGGKNTAFDVKVSNLTVAKLKDAVLPERTIKLAVKDEALGTVSFLPQSESGQTMKLGAGNKVTVTSVKAAEVVVLEAVYAEDGTLISVAPTTLKFDGAGIQTVDVSAGSKIMLWDSVKGVKPLAEAIDMPELSIFADGDIIEKDSYTAPLNTTVTAYAKANEGYVFMGWNDEDGNQVSKDAGYTFRMREDATLVAEFLKEPGVEDVVSYDLSTEKDFIKAEAGATTAMTIQNAVDAAGAPLLKVKNTDATWSCEEEGITIDESGVVTVESGFIMDSIEKDVTIKSVLNGIEKTFVITFHLYDITEDFSSVTGSWGFTTSGGVAVADGVLNLLTSSSANSTSTPAKTLDAEIAAAKVVTIKFDWKSGIEAGKGRDAYFALKDTAGNNIFLMYAAGKGNIAYSTTTHDVATAISSYNQNWYTINLTIDFESNTINGTISDANGAVVTTLTDVAITTGATNLGQMYATNVYSLTPMSIDNVCIKTY